MFRYLSIIIIIIIVVVVIIIINNRELFVHYSYKPTECNRL